MNKHKWYNEIVAWASGAEIEYRYKFKTMNKWSEWGITPAPSFDIAECYEYRIKPQPKEPQYLYVYARTGNTQVEIHRGYKEGEHAELTGRLYIGKIKLEQDDV